MAKPKSVYACAECGATALQWFGSCPSCGAAGTLSESTAERRTARAQPVPLEDVQVKDVPRLATGIGESTLLQQCLSSLSDAIPSVYVSGEESADQIALRARRLAIPVKGLRLL